MQYFFPSNLSYIRKSKKLTQEQLSELSGVDRSSISRYESDDVTIPVTQAMKLSEALNVPISDMLSTDLRFEELKNDANMLWNKYKDKLTDEDKKMIEFVIEKRLNELEKGE